jgi:hypothetical protein
MSEVKEHRLDNPTELTNRKGRLVRSFSIGMSERMRTREEAGSTTSESETEVSRSAES